MSGGVFRREVRIERPVAEVFAWHERPGALARLLPPWESAEVVAQEGGIRDGATVEVKLQMAPGVRQTWRVRHEGYVAGRQFRDVQVEGPFRRWEHTHHFLPAGSQATLLRDEIQFELPGGAWTSWSHGIVRRRLERMFTYRHAVTKTDLELPVVQPGRVLISGASGLLGSALVSYLRTQGWDVLRLVRRAARAPDEVAWQPDRGELAWPEGEPVDAVVHLAGANLAGGRWTDERKRLIRDSRIAGTRTLVEALLQAPVRPRVLVSGSAIGFYGDRGEEALPEGAGAGEGFLADVCRAWEDETRPAEEAGVRVVRVRTGVVLTAAGGALAKLLPVFRAGLGGRLADGDFWMSWIGRDDWLDVVRRAISDETLQGPVNAVGPAPVRNREFAAVLGEVVHRPARLPAPGWALHAVVGEMADEALLASTRAVPAALQEAGHRFRFPTLEGALRHELGRTG